MASRNDKGVVIMLREIFSKCGFVGYPLLFVSLLMFSFIFAQILDIFRRGSQSGVAYKTLIEPLEGVAVSLGLLGSVSGFIKAFGAFSGQLDPMRLTAGLKEAYYTTLVGLTISIIGAVSCYFFGFFNRDPIKAEK